jgi:hypothetical protein
MRAPVSRLSGDTSQYHRQNLLDSTFIKLLQRQDRKQTAVLEEDRLTLIA